MDGDKNTKSICVAKMLTLIVGAWCPLCPRSLWCDARFVSSLFCWKICAEIWVGVSLAPLLALTAGRGSLGLALLARKDAQDSLDAGQGQRSSIQVIRAAAFKPGLIYHGRVCFLGPVSKSLEVFPLMLVRLSPEQMSVSLGSGAWSLVRLWGCQSIPIHRSRTTRISCRHRHCCLRGWAEAVLEQFPRLVELVA